MSCVARVRGTVQFHQLDILVVRVDDMQFGDRHMLAAAGAERTGIRTPPAIGGAMALQSEE
jgi:hypothetical protein